MGKMKKEKILDKALKKLIKEISEEMLNKMINVTGELINKDADNLRVAFVSDILNDLSFIYDLIKMKKLDGKKLEKMFNKFIKKKKIEVPLEIGNEIHKRCLLSLAEIKNISEMTNINFNKLANDALVALPLTSLIAFAITEYYKGFMASLIEVLTLLEVMENEEIRGNKK